MSLNFEAETEPKCCSLSCCCGSVIANNIEDNVTPKNIHTILADPTLSITLTHKNSCIDL